MAQASNLPFKELLTGTQAFYNQHDYKAVSSRDLQHDKTVNLEYRHTVENKVWRVVKTIFSIIIFPIGLYHLIHSLIGKVVVLPASNPTLMGYAADHAGRSRKEISLDGEWKVKRVSVEVDGYTVDAAIMGKASTLGNGRWVLNSNGNGEFYEDKLKSYDFKQILANLEGNALVFNYPGVGASTGMPSRSAMSKAYKAMLHFLEDGKKGGGAKEIIGLGHSIGGAVQGDVLESHKLKKDVSYVFVKSRTFSDLSSVASSMTNSFLGFVTKFMGWNISSVQSSKNLKVPEIIMQTADVLKPEDISRSPQKIMHDGVISAETSLAKKLLGIKSCRESPQKYFMGIPEGHNDGFLNPDILAIKIKEMLQQK